MITVKCYILCKHIADTGKHVTDYGYGLQIRIADAHCGNAMEMHGNIDLESNFNTVTIEMIISSQAKTQGRRL